MRKRSIVAPIAALLVVIGIAIGVNGLRTAYSDQPRSLNGTWQIQFDGSKLTANIVTNKIEIKWKTTDITALYWQGTFPAESVVEPGAHILSVGNTEAMSGSILASGDDTKEFTYKNGEIYFNLTVFGVTRLVSLKSMG